jgi:hypothetical protein
MVEQSVIQEVIPNVIFHLGMIVLLSLMRSGLRSMENIDG